MITLALAALAAVIFGAVTGHWEAAIGVGVGYTFSGLIWLEAWRGRG